MNDLIDGVRQEGDILVNGQSVFDPLTEVISLRKRIGMVFQKSNPFPKSIYENVVYSLRVSGRNRKPLYRPGHRQPAGGAADGRALLGTRPDRHRQD